MKVCFVGDDVRPPWNHASSVLTKRIMECLSPSVNCTLVTTASGSDPSSFSPRWTTITTKSTGKRAFDSARLGVLADRCDADIVHVIGTNALLFSPTCKLLGSRGTIVRQIFTSYERKDGIVRLLRWLVNGLFVGAYAFTTPWIGGWDADLGTEVRKFVVRPPIDCELYRPSKKDDQKSVPTGSHEYSLLYMGPLWPSRFPARNVLGAFRRLVEKGFDVGLSVVTSTRSSIQLCEEVMAIGKQLGIDRNMLVERKDLSEPERIREYNGADLVLFPYVGPVPEQLADPPFGILEAMACEKIILSTRVLSIPEIVSDGNTGLLIDSASTEDVYRGIVRAITSRNGNDVGVNARRRVLTDFSYPVVGLGLLKSYEQLLAS